MEASKLEQLALWQWKRLTAPLLFVGVGCVCVMMSLVITLTMQPRRHEGFLFAIFAVEILPFLGGVKLYFIRKKYQERAAINNDEFGRIFGRMSFGLDAPGVRQIVQLRVDTILTQRAGRLDDACKYQEDYLKEVKAASGDVAKVEEMLGRVTALAREVRIAKVEFWNARRSAKNFGYNVKDSFKEYLDNKTESSPPSRPGYVCASPDEDGIPF